MPAKTFVDSNIWLYSLIQSGDDRHQQAADFLIQLDCPVVNSQVIREICSNLKKKKTRISEEQLRVLIPGWYQSCKVVNSNASQHLRASRLRDSHSFNYWDSLIVAAALDAGCSTLFSEDMQHGQKVEGELTIINPFIRS